MTKRETMIALARFAGYHEDKKTFTRLYVEGRVNLGIMNAAFHSGRQAKQNGVKCNCYQCKKEQNATL